MHLLHRVERYLRRSGTPPTRFGVAVLRDPQFVFDLRRGREPRLPTRQRIATYLDESEAALERRS